jgi:hypothetical protein
MILVAAVSRQEATAAPQKTRLMLIRVRNFTPLGRFLRIIMDLF